MSGPDSLRVMTYNILYDTSPTGGGSGEERWPLVVEGIREADADLVALQEVLPGRIAAIPRHLPEFRLAVSEPGGSGRAVAPLLAVSAVALVLLIQRRRRHGDPTARRGRARRLSGHAVTVALWALVLGIPGALAIGSFHVGGYGNLNERLAFLYRPEKLELVAQRTYWFSPTPLKPGTRGPFEFEPRIAQLGVFRRVHGGDTLVVLNVHPGHSSAAHASTAALMRTVLDARWRDGATQILLGDFNAAGNSPRLTRLSDPGTGGMPGFRDAWLEAPTRSGPAGTFQWGRAKRGGDLRIDHVLVRGPARVLHARTLGKTRGELVASDHDALVVDLVLSYAAE
ncbi:MAG: endonuclease/exonuclease/phosphatase family protein [Candidatus Eisenbacteria bacterium]